LTGLNDQQFVIGAGTNGIGFLWSPNQATQTPLVNILPRGLADQFSTKYTAIAPLMITNTNSITGLTSIVFSATPSVSGGGTQAGTFLMTGSAGGTGRWGLVQMGLPPNTPINAINSSGVIATIVSGSAELLLPVQFNQVYPSSGFDWVSQPPWLMVPQNSSNQAIAVTPASSTFNITFSIQPSSSNSGTTVSPTSTSSSNQTITVSGNTIGESSQVQVGVGATTTSGTNSAGLGIDVKPMITATVAIHAVSQRDGNGQPNQLCIIAGTDGILHTTELGGDNAIGSGGVITGPSGICETTAAAGDIQLLRPGLINVPQDVPTAANLQTYLNQVFGTQANVYFAATREDFMVDYDKYPRDQVLEAYKYSGVASPEEEIIYALGDTTVNYNIFFVKNISALSSNGTLTADPSVVGITHRKLKVALVCDAAGILNTTTHEIGHLLGLEHTNVQTLSNGQRNPAYIPGAGDQMRLMYPYNSGSNTLLIQPEWDIINPNAPKQ